MQGRHKRKSGAGRAKIDLGYKLLEELDANPQRFDKYGQAYNLLQCYFEGLPVETLRPFLQSDDIFAQRSAAFIASELSSEAKSIIDDVVPLVNSPDGHVEWYAMEVLTVCAIWEHAEKFTPVVLKLESDEGSTRRHAMFLIANAQFSQLEGALRVIERQSSVPEMHRQGLKTLIADDQADPGVISAMIQSCDPLVRRYGAIAAKKQYQRHPELLVQVYESDDSDLEEFGRDALRSLSRTD